MAKDNPPSGCQHCGNDARTHAIEYAEGIGYHVYAAGHRNDQGADDRTKGGS